MGDCIEMIAHCIFHQTPPSERIRCEECGVELRESGKFWYCPQCLRQQEVVDCPICSGKAWI